MLRIMLISIALMLLTGIAAADDDDLAPVSIQLQWVPIPSAGNTFCSLSSLLI